MRPRQKVVAQLEETSHRTLAFFEERPSVLRRSYAPRKWTMQQILVHLSDSETVLLDRLRRLLSEKQPLLLAFDQDRWAKELFYPKRSLELARSQYIIARLCVIELAKTLPIKADEKAGTHSEAGPMTFGKVLARVASHNAHHLEQLEAIAAGRTWPD